MGRALLELHSFLMCVSVCEQSHTHICGQNTQCKAPLRSYLGSEQNPPIFRGQILSLQTPLMRNGRVGTGEMMSLVLEVFNIPLSPSSSSPLSIGPSEETNLQKQEYNEAD